jgi:hypothetical protein
MADYILVLVRIWQSLFFNNLKKPKKIQTILEICETQMFTLQKNVVIYFNDRIGRSWIFKT